MDVTKPDRTTVPPPSLRILILEDNVRDAKLMASALEGGVGSVQYEVTDSPEVFRERLEKVEYDVILADFNLRNWTALDALEILKRSGKDIPLILVTGSLGDEAAVECIKQGAADFVLKDRPARLPTAVQRALEEKRLRTENKRAFEAISQLATIVESSDDAIFSTTREGFIATWNAGAERIYGYSAGEIKGKHFSVLIPEDRRSDMAANQERLSHHEALVHYEFEHLGKDGSRRQVSETLSPIKDAAGVVTAISVIARDITERKRAEQMLQEYERVVEGSDELIVVIDRGYRYLLANRAFLDMRGLERGDVVGHLAPEVLGEELFEGMIKKHLAECFQGNVVRYEMKYPYPKLGDRDLQVSYFPIEGSRGIDRAACVMQDITERKRAEAEHDPLGNRH